MSFNFVRSKSDPILEVKRNLKNESKARSSLVSKSTKTMFIVLNLK